MAQVRDPVRAIADRVLMVVQLSCRVSLYFPLSAVQQQQSGEPLGVSARRSDGETDGHEKTIRAKQNKQTDTRAHTATHDTRTNNQRIDTPSTHVCGPLRSSPPLAPLSPRRRPLFSLSA